MKQFANKPELFNFLIGDFGLTDYLEIGLGVGSLNMETFREVKCENKTGVDPNPIYGHREHEGLYRTTSDGFFQNNEKTFDLIFIDGLHVYEQALQDFYNAVKCLKEGGIIVMHDVGLESEWETHVFNCGTAYMAWLHLRLTMTNMNFCTVMMKRSDNEIEEGREGDKVGLAWVDPNCEILELESNEISWRNYWANRDKILNVKTIEEVRELK